MFFIKSKGLVFYYQQRLILKYPTFLKFASYFCSMIEDKNQNRTHISDLGEFGLIDHLTKNFKIKQSSTVKGIGDDAAVLNFENKKIVVTTDLLVEGGAF